MTGKPVERFRWRDLRNLDASLFRKVCVWQGWLWSPSLCLLAWHTNRCTYCWREQRKREKLKRRLG